MFILIIQTPNGERYPRVGGTRQRCFAGTSFKPHKLLKNAATPTRRVHAVLGGIPVYTMKLPKEILDTVLLFILRKADQEHGECPGQGKATHNDQIAGRTDDGIENELIAA